MQTYPTGYAESHRIAEQIFGRFCPGTVWQCASSKSHSATKFWIPYIIKRFPCAKQA